MDTMQRYTGTKTVLATPMSRGEYNLYRGWTLPDNEDGGEAGFLVEYTDGGKPNDERHAGYISWLSADVFTAAYAARPLVDGLLPFQQRVVDEKAELDARKDALCNFLNSPAFQDVRPLEQRRMLNQHATMTTLSAILGERIADF
jgi:hypothetical protein